MSNTGRKRPALHPLHRPVRQAQRRLWVNRWLGALGWCLAGGALVFMGAVLADRLWLALPNAGRVLAIVGLGVTGLSLVTSVIWALFTRDSMDIAASRLDEAAGLKERISSGLFCEDVSDPFAQAVVADAARVARGLPVREHMPIRFPQSANWAGGTLVLALLLFLLFPSFDLAGKQQVRVDQERKLAEIKRVEMVVKPAIEQQLKQAADRNPLLKKEMEDLEAMKEARLETPLDVRQEAFKKVEKLSEKLEEKRKSSEMAQMDEFKKMIRRAADQQKNDNSGVGALAKAMSQGDFNAAQKAVEQIKQELAKSAETPEEKQKAEALKRQLEQLSKKLEETAQDQKKTQDELAKSGLTQEEIKRALESLQKKDLDQLKKQLADKGLSQQKIDKLMQEMKKNAAAQQACSKLGQGLAKAAQGASGTGQLSQSAAEGLSAASEQLSDMESLQQEMNQLTSSLSDLESLKQGLGQGCKQCNGSGMCNGKPCGACNGSGCLGPGGNPNARGSGMGKLGQGQGGAAPEEETAAKTVQRRTQVNTLPGRIISQQFVDGEQYKGEVSKEFREAAIAAQRDVTDAIAREQIPRSIQGPVSKYFTRTFGDVPSDKDSATQDKDTAAPAEDKPAQNP